MLSHSLLKFSGKIQGLFPYLILHFTSNSSYCVSQNPSVIYFCLFSILPVRKFLLLALLLFYLTHLQNLYVGNFISKLIAWFKQLLVIPI